MKKSGLVMSILLGTLLWNSATVLAADQDREQDRARSQDQDQVYGSQLMTDEERAEYRARLRSAKTREERDQIRKEHHERMKERAKERGITLPDEPPERGHGMGPGGGRR